MHERGTIPLMVTYDSSTDASGGQRLTNEPPKKNTFACQTLSANK